MKKSLILPLTDEELMELQRMLLDSDRDGALQQSRHQLKQPNGQKKPITYKIEPMSVLYVQLPKLHPRQKR